MLGKFERWHGSFSEIVTLKGLRRMRKKIFKGSSRARYCNHFFQHCFHSPINYTNPYLHLAELFFSLFFSTMQYKAISNAVNCFCSQIKHYLNFLSWASLSFMRVAGAMGCGVRAKSTQSISLVWKKGRHFYCFMKFLSPREFHWALWNEHRSRPSAPRVQ